MQNTVKAPNSNWESGRCERNSDCIDGRCLKQPKSVVKLTNRPNYPPADTKGGDAKRVHRMIFDEIPIEPVRNPKLTG